MNRKQLRSELAWFVNVNESGADQDFQTSRLNKAIDRAYNLILEEAKLHGGKDYFRGASADVTWAAAAQQLTMPTAVSAVTLESVYDITAGEPGYPLTIASDSTQQCAAFWYDKDTLQWLGVGGPSSALTLRFYYEGVAEPMLSDESEPEYIPDQFQWLIVVRAAILLKGVADESVPQAWREEREALEHAFYKHISRGRPLSNYPRIGGGGATGGTRTDNVDLTAPGSSGLNPP